jgi:hypothetical protein
MLIHDVLLDAVHEQALLVETLTVDVPLPRPTLWLVGEIEYEHTSAACATVNVWPATVKVPVREPLVFGSTAYCTLPLPLPDPPEMMPIHDALLAAVHEQPLVVATFTVPVVPSTGALALVGEREYEHDAGGGDGGGDGSLAPACVTVNARPAIVRVPVRAAPVFAATLNATEPLPVPVAPAWTLIHDALLVAVHWHEPPAVTVTGAPAPPAAPMFWPVGEIVALHAGGGGGGAGVVTPACVMVGRWLTTEIVPVRASPWLGATVKLTRPVPVPVADDVSVIQPTSTTAVHAQSLAVAVIARLPAPPLAPTLWFDGPTS